MKTNLIYPLLTIAALILLTNCTKEDQTAELSGISVTPSEATIIPGEITALTAAMTPEEYDSDIIVWSTDNGTVASVSQDGIVSAVSPGTATITAHAGPFKSTCTVTVVPFPEPGDYYYEDGSWSRDLKEGLKVIGLVFYSDNTNRTGKIVSLSQEKLCVGPEGEIIGADSQTDGLGNMDKVLAIPDWEDNYPGFCWCYDLTDGYESLFLQWYLPALVEIRQLMAGMCGLSWIPSDTPAQEGEIADWGDNTMPEYDKYTESIKAFNTRMEAASGTPIVCVDTEGYGVYWTSTEKDQDNMYYIDLGYGGFTNFYSKAVPANIRAVAEIKY